MQQIESFMTFRLYLCFEYDICYNHWCLQHTDELNFKIITITFSQTTCENLFRCLSCAVLFLSTLIWAPSHYLNQCWLITKCNMRNKLHWNLTKNESICFQEIAFEDAFCKMSAILFRTQHFNVLSFTFYCCIGCVCLVSFSFTFYIQFIYDRSFYDNSENQIPVLLCKFYLYCCSTHEFSFF